MCESGDPFSIWTPDCASALAAVGIGKSECPAAQTLVVKAQIGHLFTDCMACDCSSTDCICEKWYFPADCSIHCQGIAEDDFEVQQPGMAIACTVHRQTWQSIQCLCLAGPALLVGQPSHSQQPDLHSAAAAPATGAAVAAACVVGSASAISTSSTCACFSGPASSWSLSAQAIPCQE